MASSSSIAKEGKGENTTHTNWLELPRDLMANILRRLGAIEILTSARNVCPLWWNICKNPLMWRTIDLSYDISSDTDPNYMMKICCYAIDLSSGLLEEIDTGVFGSDYLLQYIADRASNLRRMELVDYPWNSISDKGLIKAVEKLSVLEELDISSLYYRLTKESLEVIGRCCPLLKSLKYDVTIFDEEGLNEVSFAIAKTMPELRRLKISGIILTNVGLLAILDGCSFLESLDLRGCSNHNGLSASVQKRCHHQIKDVQLPEKSLSILELASALAEVDIE